MPLLYAVISEASGDVGEAHMPDCQDKNCRGRNIEQLEAQGQREEESIDVLYNAHSLDKQETVAQIKLGRRLCSVLRFRAKCMGLPMNTDGYVPLALLLRHPAFGGYTIEDICDLARTDPKQRYKIVKDENANLHIRAQNGHGYMTPVRIKHAEVSLEDLPNEVTHCSLRANLADILSSERN